MATVVLGTSREVTFIATRIYCGAVRSIGILLHGRLRSRVDLDRGSLAQIYKEDW